MSSNHTVKSRTDYSGKQWKQLFRECRACVDNIRQQQRALLPPRAKGKPALNSNSAANKKMCAGCDTNKTSADFSTKQWSHGHHADRWCKVCWAEEELARQDHRHVVALHNQHQEPKGSCTTTIITTKRCFACREFKALEQHFLGKQQKKPYGMCVPCVIIIQANGKKNTANTTNRECFLCHESKVYVIYFTE